MDVDDVSGSDLESSGDEREADHLKADFEKEAEKEVKKGGIGMITSFFEGKLDHFCSVLTHAHTILLLEYFYYYPTKHGNHHFVYLF